MIVGIDEAGELGERLRTQGNEVVFTNGCFDILHAGHVWYLEQAKALGSTLVVGVNADASVRNLKGPHRPVNEESDRAAVLNALRCVDYVIVFDAETPMQLIASLQPDVLVKGGDYTRDTIVGADLVEDRGGRVIVIPLLPGRSTTSIIQRSRSAT